MTPARDYASLAAADPIFGAILDQRGTPPRWRRPPGFVTLVQIVLEQQVSLQSGRAAYLRLQERIGAVAPARLVAAGAPTLRGAGITRQKSGYLVALADAIERGELALQELARLDDEVVVDRLTALPGIGAWTANVYLLLAQVTSLSDFR